MYVEEIVKKHKNAIYTTALVRESYRVGPKVSHRTIANISKLPKDCIEEIKRRLRGNLTHQQLELAKLKIIESKEYGATKALQLFMKSLDVDLLIDPSRSPWADDILAMLVNKLVYPVLPMTHAQAYSCSDPEKRELTLQKSFNKYLINCKSMQKKNIKKHHQAEALLFCYNISCSTKYDHFGLNENYLDSIRSIKYSHDKVDLSLFTNQEHCPLTIETSLYSDRLESQRFQEKLSEINHQNSLTVMIYNNYDSKCHCPDPNHPQCKFITTLSHLQTIEILREKTIPANFFSSDLYPDISDSTNPEIRYIFCSNSEQKKCDELLRKQAINKTKQLLKETEELNRQSKIENIRSTVEQICHKYNTLRFFDLHFTESDFTFAVRKNKIKEESRIDGLYALKTNLKKETLSNDEVLKAYSQLMAIQKFFNIIPISFTDDLSAKYDITEQFSAHAFLHMLAYYVKYCMMKKIKQHLSDDGAFNAKFKGLEDVILCLKKIYLQTVQINDTILTNFKTTIDSDQEKILAALGVSLS